MFELLKNKIPKLCLAPMAGLTDLPFRELCRWAGGVQETFVPMIGLTALLDKGSRRHTMSLLNWKDAPTDRQVQIFASKVEEFAPACRLLLDLGASAFNLNLGCQVPKIIKNGAGAALLQNLDQALRIIEAGVKASDGRVPVSVKLRLGWDYFNIDQLLPKMKNLGVSAVFIHGRLASDQFGGRVRWPELYSAAQVCSVPFYANGDITDFSSAFKMFSLPNCQGLMIGRAALGRPDIFADLDWLFRQVCGWKNDISFDRIKNLEIERLREKKASLNGINLARKHVALAQEYQNDSELAVVRRLRRHLSAYSCLSRDKIMQAETFAQLEQILSASTENL
ncbi:MAG: tRNA dihydrouridine synthase [Candidatus Bruticola sp.]